MTSRSPTHISFPDLVSCIFVITTSIVRANRFVDVTLNEVKLMLAKEDHARAKEGTDTEQGVSTASTLLLGMDIETVQ